MLPDFLAQGKSVQIRQHHVQNGQIQLFPLHTFQGLGSVQTLMDGKSLILQVDLHQTGDGLLIIHDHNGSAHWILLNYGKTLVF